MTTPRDRDLLRFDGWPGGVNNRIQGTEHGGLRDERISMPATKFVRKALNVDFTAEGHPLRRRGWARQLEGYVHSAWGSDQLGVFLSVVDGALCAGPTPGDLAAIASANQYLAMSYAVFGDMVLATNGAEGFAYVPSYDQALPWALPKPPAPNAMSVAVYVDWRGREHAASTPTDGAGSSAPLPTGAVSMRTYVADNLGPVADTVPGDDVIDTVYRDNGLEVGTLHLDPMPVGQLLTASNGRIYVAQDDVIWFSEPLQPHLCRMSTNLYRAPSKVTLLQGTDNGVYVGHGRGVYFVSGKDPFDTQQKHVSPYAPVAGAYSRIPGEKFGLPEGEVPVWWGTDGVLMAGLPGGEVTQLTRDRLAVSKFRSGAVSLREREGMSHIVSALRNGGGMGGMVASDSVVAEIRRNGN
mgnify:CR=1 FL=1